MRSIRWRFGIGIASSAMRLGISVASMMTVARLLGPVDYGRLTFLAASMAAFRQCLDLGTSTAFFTLVSGNHRGPAFLRRYWSWLALQLVVGMLTVGLVLPQEVFASLWTGEGRVLVALALVATFTQGAVWNAASQLGEANRETARTHAIALAASATHLIAVIALWHWGILAIWTIFAATALEWGVASWAAARLYRRGPHLGGAPEGSTRDFIREFASICLPLVPYGILGFGSQFGERWMLQRWGGPEQQGLFGIAQQLSTVAFVTTGALTPLLWKEAAVFQEGGETKRATDLYASSSGFLFLASASLASMLIPWSGEILRAAAGQQYSGAVFTFTIMLLYPVHQSIGQAQGALFYATRRATMQVVLGSTTMLVGLVVSYALLAPDSMSVPGLGLAAAGLAYRLVAVQAVSVTVADWILLGRRRCLRRFGLQVVLMGAMLLLATCLKASVTILLPSTAHTVVGCAISCGAFVAAVVTIAYRCREGLLRVFTE